MKNKKNKLKKKTEKFKIPKKLFLLGEVYRTEFKKLEKDDAGFIDFTNKVIQFDTSLDQGKNDAELRHVFWHELAGHYLSDYYGLEDSEIFAEAFSKFIISIIDQLQNENNKI